MIEFIDLSAQQLRIKSNLDAAIQRVLAHGQYILGLKSANLNSGWRHLSREILYYCCQWYRCFANCPNGTRYRSRR